MLVYSYILIVFTFWTLLPRYRVIGAFMFQYINTYLSVCVLSLITIFVFIIHGQLVMDTINVYSFYRNVYIMHVLYRFCLIQTAPYTFIFNFIEKRVYHVGTIHYPLPFMCAYILSLLLFYHYCIIITRDSEVIMFSPCVFVTCQNLQFLASMFVCRFVCLSVCLSVCLLVCQFCHA